MKMSLLSNIIFCGIVYKGRVTTAMLPDSRNIPSQNRNTVGGCQGSVCAGQSRNIGEGGAEQNVLENGYSIRGGGVIGV
jgi:hypothetical protein